jgi:hypothetical protein
MSAWLIRQFLNGNVLFNQLKLLAGDVILNNCYSTFYRNKSYVAAQAEYCFLPFPFSKRFGATLFAALGTVAPKISQISSKKFSPVGGG